jgi:hypothetical protein
MKAEKLDLNHLVDQILVQPLSFEIFPCIQFMQNILEGI